MKNNLLFNAAAALIDCARFVNPIDKGFAQELLDKAESYSKLIIIDEKVEKEVGEFEKEIKAGLEKDTE